MRTVKSDDYSDHGLPIGAEVELLESKDDVDLYTMGGVGDEVAIDPRDLEIEEWNGLPLRLSFTPSAIREHFADGDDDLSRLSDEQLASVGEAALADGRLYKVFHEVLLDALGNLGVEQCGACGATSSDAGYWDRHDSQNCWADAWEPDE